MRDVVQWGRTSIEYHYRYKDRKTLAIHVHPDLSITVDAPKGTELTTIRERVLKRAAWIRQARQDFKLYLPKQPPRQYVNGESHHYLGRQYRIKARKGSAESIRCYRGYFDIKCRGEPSSSYIRAMMESWYWDRANTVFKVRFREMLKKVPNSEVDESALVIKKLKTRWGSCSQSGKITLNLELIQAPTECIDYVILHELCHLKEHNHGQKFWALLKRLLPDYSARKHRLNTLLS